MYEYNVVVTLSLCTLLQAEDTTHLIKQPNVLRSSWPYKWLLYQN